jgi:plastocyanin
LQSRCKFEYIPEVVRYPIVAAVLAVLLLPAGASAADIGGAELTNAGPGDGSCDVASTEGTRTSYTCRYGPVEVDGYQVRQVTVNGIPRPPGAGHITAMDVDVVDANGAQVPIQRLMLHHIVFANLSRPDGTCNHFKLWDNKTDLGFSPQRFYGAGEERAKFALPPGYGYKLDAADNWLMAWMFMNHRGVTDHAFIQYHVTVDSSPDIADANPYWLDVRNCQADPVFDVPGGGGPSATYKQKSTWTVPQSGRLLGGGGHVHGGGQSLVITEPDCGDREIGRSEPLWGMPSNPYYHVKPVLHEPGPIAMSYWGSLHGIPVTAGQRLKLTATYDNSRPHTRVMGIEMIYIAPDSSVDQGCGPLPGDRFQLQSDQPGRTSPPRFTVPLTGLNARGRAIRITHPPGPTKVVDGGSADVNVADFRFSRPNLLVRRGTTVRWRFEDGPLHNVTLASGPRGFSSPNLNGGRSFKAKLTKPGRYQLFCALHPVAMTESIVVK